MGLFTNFTLKLYIRSLSSASDQQLIRQAAHYSALYMQVGGDRYKAEQVLKRMDALRSEMQRRGMTSGDA